MEYTVYLDALLLIVAFLSAVHFLILWAAGQILKIKTSFKLVLVGSLLGSACDCLGFFLELFQFHIPLRLLEALITLVSLAAACRISYPSVTRQLLVKAIGYVYLFTIISAGSSLAIYYLTGENVWAFRIAAVGSLLVIIEAGWGVIQNKVWPEAFRLAIEVVVDDKEIVASALIDTGNSLRDPLTKSHVVVLEYKAAEALIPEEVRGVFQRREGDALSSLAAIRPQVPWSSRVRVIPYASLGKENGILMGFRPDYVRIRGSQGSGIIKDAIIGIHPGTLSSDREYQALVAPDIISACQLQPEFREKMSAQK